MRPEPDERQRRLAHDDRPCRRSKLHGDDTEKIRDDVSDHNPETRMTEGYCRLDESGVPEHASVRQGKARKGSPRRQREHCADMYTRRRAHRVRTASASMKLGNACTRSHARSTARSVRPRRNAVTAPRGVPTPKPMSATMIARAIARNSADETRASRSTPASPQPRGRAQDEVHQP